ncbi:MAG: hypothetical protein ACQESR_21885 [Planctomycetota bacterium]
MESCPTQAVLPLVGLAAEKVIRDRCISLKDHRLNASEENSYAKALGMLDLAGGVHRDSIRNGFGEAAT